MNLDLNRWTWQIVVATNVAETSVTIDGIVVSFHISYLSN